MNSRFELNQAEEELIILTYYMYSEVMSTFKRTFYSKTGNIKLQVNKSNVAQLFSATKKELGMRSQVGFILAFKQQFGSRFTASSSFHRSSKRDKTFSPKCSTFVISFSTVDDETIFCCLMIYINPFNIELLVLPTNQSIQHINTSHPMLSEKERS